MSENNIDQKLRSCCDELKKLSRLVIAFSGGTDSTLLLRLARDELGTSNVLAVTIVSQLQHKHETALARKSALDMGVKLLEIPFDALEIDEISANSPRRCYHCKKALLSKIIQAADQFQTDHVASATNCSDLSDYRPGMQAEKELNIFQPFITAGINKRDIIEISKMFKLPTADLPSNACLASRIPYNTPLTIEKLARIEQAESALRNRGFKKVRVRDHGPIARIEVASEDIKKILDSRQEITNKLKSLGYSYITIDLEGFRTGSMNIF